MEFCVVGSLVGLCVCVVGSLVGGLEPGSKLKPPVDKNAHQRQWARWVTSTEPTLAAR